MANLSSLAAPAEKGMLMVAGIAAFEYGLQTGSVPWGAIGAALIFGKYWLTERGRWVPKKTRSHKKAPVTTGM